MVLVLAELDAVLEQIGTDIGDGLQIAAAGRIAGAAYPQVNPGQPLLISELNSGELAHDVQAALLALYPADHAVALVTGDVRAEASLGRLEEDGTFGPGTWLFVPAGPAPGDYTDLQEVVARLRAPDGCPWDRELTWQKLRSSLLEETYELLAALDAEDADKVAEEQGDLLLQIAMQVQIAMEEGRYRFADVIRLIVDKLIRRHPHVFGEVTVSGTDEVLANWEAIKRAERESRNEVRSPLAGIPPGLPALAQADAYLDRMSRLAETAAPEAPWAALAALPSDAPVDAGVVGETLLQMVAWARSRGIDSESALRRANERYRAGVDRAMAHDNPNLSPKTQRGDA